MDMKYCQKIAALMVLVFLSVQSIEVKAQMDWIGPLTSGAIAGQVAENAMDNMDIPKDDADDAELTEEAKQDNIRKNTKPAKNANNSLTFTPDLQVRKQTLNKLLADFERVQPGADVQLRPFLFGNGDGDIIQKLQPELLSKYGLSVNNLADAYALYWVSAWQTSNGVFDKEPSLKQMKAVQAQVSRALFSLPVFANASASQKQAYSEVLLVQALVAASFGDQVKAGTMKLSNVKDGIRKGAKALGVDLDGFVLIETGFILVKGKK
jgi:hypothetical protein